MVVAAAVPVVVLVGFALHVLTHGPSRAGRIAAWSAIGLATAIAVVVTWLAVEFARTYRF